MTRLCRESWPAAGPPRPVRAVHLGLGAFHRSHQAWYTEHAADRDAWGIAGFTGRSPGTASLLQEQGGLYTLVERGPARDRPEVVASISAAHDGDDARAWAGWMSDPSVAVVTLTVTEAGYRLDGAGHLDRGHPDVEADLSRLRPGHDAAACPARTMPGRLATGLAARRRSGAGPISVVPCDNLMANGAVTRNVVLEICETVDPSLTRWVEANVSFVSTVVDRITPATLVEDLALVERAIGREDRAAVVAEPFSEWVLAGEFPAGRPDWASAGARLVADVAPFAERKLGLLNGGHSLLAYAGSSLGHSTVAGAVADTRCRAWLEEWWDGAAGVLPLPADEVDRYRLALLDRWANPRISHPLSSIARDGSLKLVQRVLPVIHRYRAIGQAPPPGAARILGAWLAHLRGSGAPIAEPRAAELVPLAAGERSAAARALLDALEPGLGGDPGLAREVAATCQELEGIRR